MSLQPFQLFKQGADEEKAESARLVIIFNLFTIEKAIMSLDTRITNDKLLFFLLLLNASRPL
jgi:hypothetical protein